MQNAHTPELRKIGYYGAQTVELHTGTAALYVGGRITGTLGIVLRQYPGPLKIHLTTEIEEQIIATTIARERIRLNKLSHVLQIDNPGRFLTAITHAVVKAKPHGRSEEDQEHRTELDIILDEAKKLCSNGNGKH